MIIFTNDNNEIKDVGYTTDVSLIGRVIDDDENPFKGWSTAKICCYKAIVDNGRVVMMTPYVDSRLLYQIDMLGKGEEANASDISDVQDAVTETYEATVINSEDITDAQDAITETFEMTASNSDDITDIQDAVTELYELYESLAPTEEE